MDSSGQELELWVERIGLEQAKAMLQQKKLIIGSIGLSVEWRHDEASFQAGLERLVRDARIAAELGCKACCTYVLPSTDQPALEFLMIATRRLKLCAKLLSSYGIRLGLEFVGPHHLRTTWQHPFLWTLPQFLSWIELIDERNVGLLLDAFHWHTTEASVQDILQLKPEQIVHVHINDAPHVPVSEVKDNVRLYPDEGVIDLHGFLIALREIGYRGVVAQEILTPEPPAQSAEALAQRSQAAYDKIFQCLDLDK